LAIQKQPAARTKIADKHPPLVRGDFAMKWVKLRTGQAQLSRGIATDAHTRPSESNLPVA
jgi:hypothetical protein